MTPLFQSSSTGDTDSLHKSLPGQSTPETEEPGQPETERTKGLYSQIGGSTAGNGLEESSQKQDGATASPAPEEAGPAAGREGGKTEDAADESRLGLFAIAGLFFRTVLAKAKTVCVVASGAVASHARSDAKWLKALFQRARPRRLAVIVIALLAVSAVAVAIALAVPGGKNNALTGAGAHTTAPAVMNTQTPGNTAAATLQASTASALPLITATGIEPTASLAMTEATPSASQAALPAIQSTLSPTQKSTPKPTSRPTPRPTPKPTPRPTPKPAPKPTISLVTVPNLVGKTKAQAQSDLTIIGLKASFAEQWNNSVPKDNVITQSVVAGTKVNPGTTVTVTISKGVQYVIVPNLIGKSKADAKATIQAAGLTIGIEYHRYKWDVAINYVFEQSNTIGASVPAGTSINIVFSDGAKPLAVGDIVYFRGGKDFNDSFGGLPSYNLSARNVKITVIANLSRPYPYHIASTGGSAYGWVSGSLLEQRTD